MTEESRQPLEELANVGVVVLGAHGPGDAAQRDGAPEVEGQRAARRQQLLGVEAAEGGLVVGRRELVAQEALEGAIVAGSLPVACTGFL